MILFAGRDTVIDETSSCYKWRCFLPCLLEGKIATIGSSLSREIIRCPNSKPHDIEIAQLVGYWVGGPVFESG